MTVIATTIRITAVISPVAAIVAKLIAISSPSCVAGPEKSSPRTKERSRINSMRNPLSDGGHECRRMNPLK